MEEKISADSTVDAVGLFCPIPMVKLKLELEKVSPGQVVKIMADDPAFPEDLKTWCQETQNRVLSITEEEGGVFVAYVERQEEDSF